MEQFLRAIEPRSMTGVVMRFIVFVILIGASNFAFAFSYDGRLTQDPAYYVIHAIVVGGPFAAIALSILMLQVKLQRKLSYLSRKDGLTGLNNRRSFFELTERHHRANHSGVLLLIDADNFKDINDTYGHQAGDECLKAISRALSGNTRKDDVVGRIGGEEFAIFLNGATEDQARMICERLTQPISCRAVLDAQSLSVTLSVGAVSMIRDASLDLLIAYADKALYQAKTQGRARMVMWNDVEPIQMVRPAATG